MVNQVWDAVLSESLTVQVEYNGGETMIVNDMSFRVGIDKHNSNRFCYYGIHHVEVARVRGSKSSCGPYCLFIDGMMAEEKGVGLRNRQEGSYAITA